MDKLTLLAAMALNSKCIMEVLAQGDTQTAKHVAKLLLDQITELEEIYEKEPIPNL